VSLPLAGSTSDEVPAGATLVVPVGSVEQHGPHLPLDTDRLVAGELATRLCATHDGLVLAPALPYGASGEHEGAAGTVSIGTEALTRVLVELGRSATRWAARVLFVNGHGGNLDALTAAVSLLRHEGRDVAWWSWSLPGADAHAGATETSLLLALDPGRVRHDRIEVGDTRPLAELLPLLREHGVPGVSPNGVLGDPTRADAAAGARAWTRLATDLAAAVSCWAPDADGRLPGDPTSVHVPASA
jgi:mycofactocin precursor peptide peptidase